MQLLVNIDVPDLAEAERFYIDAFGLKPGRRFDGTVELLGLDAPLYLLARAAGTKATPAQGALRHYGRHWTPIHLDFVVEDIDAAVKRATDAGARLESAPRSAIWGTIALLSDPFGNGFCLIAFTEAGYDAIARPENPPAY